MMVAGSEMSLVENIKNQEENGDPKMGKNHLVDHIPDDDRNPETETSKWQENRKLYQFGLKLLLVLLLWAHFIWATYYFVVHSDLSLDETTCSGYGFLLIIFVFINYGILYSLAISPYCIPFFVKVIYTPASNSFDKAVTPIRNSQFSFVVTYAYILFYLAIFAAFVGYLVYDSSGDNTRLIPLSGMVAYVLFGFALSSNRKMIPWNTVFMGITLQLVFALLTIRWDTGRNIFDCLGQKVNIFLGYAVNGSAFVYGEDLVYHQGVFAFKALATIFFLAFFINILYFYGIMQKVVASLGRFLKWAMRTSICESCNSAANIFLGMSEAPLLLKPYLQHLTDSELHSVMTAGFATVSGTVLAAYISFGANPAHLITASVMSAPAALCFSKLLYPETEEIRATEDTIQEVKMEYDSVLDAASQGAHDAFNIVAGIISSLVAFIAFIYFVNGVLSWMGELVGFVNESEQWTVDLILGKVFIPVSFIMGVPWEDCEKVGQLIGIKTMVNEFAAFQRMSTMDLLPRSKIIATYSICGFSNPGSIGITISALGALIPDRREVITRLVFRAFIGGAVACFMTACIAGMLIPTD